MSKLRPYQQEFKDDIMASLAAGHRTLAVLPTGGGKTVVFSDIAKDRKNTGRQTWFWSHRNHILTQIAIEVASNTDIIPHFIAGNASYIRSRVKRENRYAVQNGMFQCAMIQSMKNRAGRIQLMKKGDLIIVDEAHHAVSPQWAHMIEHVPAHVDFLGFTATPHRLDGYGLDPVFDNMVLGKDVPYLIDNGYLAQPIVYAPDVLLKRSDIKKNSKTGEFNATDSGEKMAKLAGDHVRDYVKYCDGKSMIAFCCSISHAKSVYQEFTNAGISARLIHSDMETHEQFAAIDALKSKQTMILISVDMVAEGFDVPHVDGIICLRQTNSVSMWRQMCGRALRPYEGKQFAYILDHAGNARELGMPTDKIHWSLKGEKSGFVEKITALKECESCLAILRAGAKKCHHCGEPVITKTRDLPSQDLDANLIKI